MTEHPASERYSGSCHCGSVKFELKLSQPIYEQKVSSCNCEVVSLSSRVETQHRSLSDFSYFTFRQKSKPINPSRLMYSEPASLTRIQVDFLLSSTQCVPNNMPFTGSICTRNGYLFVRPYDRDVTLLSGRDTMTKYEFNAERVAHYFCPRCGTSVCAKSNDSNFFFDQTILNVSGDFLSQSLFNEDPLSCLEGLGKSVIYCVRQYWLIRVVVAIVRLLEGVEADKLQTKHIDGKSL